MRVSAIMATFPARKSVVGRAVASLIDQVDEISVIANQYEPGELDGLAPKGTRIVVPPHDLKDTGKFFLSFARDQYVALCDDDILYPADYIARLRAAYAEHERLTPVVGVHGVTYSDFFDGSPAARRVHGFHRGLARREFVNQLGTGTVFCRASQLPDFAFMASAARFVDLRFAVHCQRSGYPRLCIEREAGWMRELECGPSLFESYTRQWPNEVTREAQEIAGLRFLPALGAPL